MTPEDKTRLRNLLAYPEWTPTDKIVWLALSVCPLTQEAQEQIDVGDYLVLPDEDFRLLAQATSLTVRTVKRSLEKFDIWYYCEHLIPPAMFVVEGEREA